MEMGVWGRGGCASHGGRGEGRAGVCMEGMEGGCGGEDELDAGEGSTCVGEGKLGDGMGGDVWEREGLWGL